MNPFNFAVVGLRIMGIYLILGSGALFATVALMGGFMTQMTKNTPIMGPAILFASLIPGIVQTGLGLGLIIFTVPLARRLTPIATDDAKSSAWSLVEVEALAFAAVGLLILTGALPNIGRAWQEFSLWLNFQPENGADKNRVIQGLLYAMGICAQIFIGLFLILNAQGFRNIWHKLRTAGTGSKLTD